MRQTFIQQVSVQYSDYGQQMVWAGKLTNAQQRAAQSFKREINNWVTHSGQKKSTDIYILYTRCCSVISCVAYSVRFSDGFSFYREGPIVALLFTHRG